MIRGGQKTASDKPARKASGDGFERDRTLGARNTTRSNLQPRQTSKSTMLNAMLRYPGLTDEDREAIRAATEETFDLAVMQANLVLQTALVHRFLESGELAAKDVVVALGKIGSQIGSVVQIGTTTATAVPSEIKITWGDGNRRTAPQSADRPVRRVADAVAGDVIDCD